VTALGAGVWDFLRYPRDPGELSLTLQAYAQAKHNIDVAMADDLVDPLTVVHGRAVLARRARELGALMARRHGALACIVFAVATDAMDSQVLNAVVRAARVSDVIGTLGPTEFAVLAPSTDHAGAVRFAHRVANVLGEATAGPTRVVPGMTLRVGYDAVANLRYSPSDPVDLLVRASAAVKSGTPEPGVPWVRRFEGVPTTASSGPLQPRTTPPGIVLDTRGTSL
jgi:PleD family two-component response regulator